MISNTELVGLIKDWRWRLLGQQAEDHQEASKENENDNQPSSTTKHRLPRNATRGLVTTPGAENPPFWCFKYLRPETLFPSSRRRDFLNGWLRSILTVLIVHGRHCASVRA